MKIWCTNCNQFFTLIKVGYILTISDQQPEYVTKMNGDVYRYDGCSIQVVADMGEPYTAYKQSGP